MGVPALSAAKVVVGREQQKHKMALHPVAVAVALIITLTAVMAQQAVSSSPCGKEQI